jgi:hypothetical protein
VSSLAGCGVTAPLGRMLLRFELAWTSAGQLQWSFTLQTTISVSTTPSHHYHSHSDFAALRIQPVRETPPIYINSGQRATSRDIVIVIPTTYLVLHQQRSSNQESSRFR